MINEFLILDLSRSLRRVRRRHLPRLVVAWRHLAAEDGLALLLRRLLHHRRQLHPQAGHRPGTNFTQQILQLLLQKKLDRFLVILKKKNIF